MWKWLTVMSIVQFGELHCMLWIQSFTHINEKIHQGQFWDLRTREWPEHYPCIPRLYSHLFVSKKNKRKAGKISSVSDEDSWHKGNEQSTLFPESLIIIAFPSPRPFPAINHYTRSLEILILPIPFQLRFPVASSISNPVDNFHFWFLYNLQFFLLWITSFSRGMLTS